MTISIYKNSVRVATYHYKSKAKAKTLAALKAFYNAVYAGKNVKLTYEVTV